MTSSVFSKILKQHNLQDSEDFNARSKSLETYLKYPQVHLIKSHSVSHLCCALYVMQVVFCLYCLILYVATFSLL